MKSGQRKGRVREPFYKKFQRKINPHLYLETELVLLDNLNEESRALWREYENYLAGEREKVLDQIVDVLQETSTYFSTESAGRIVGLKFSSAPLSCRGSYLEPPGGRFNFGQSISYQNYFPALYVASNFNTAFAEKFKQEKNEEGSSNFKETDFALRRPESFSFHRISLLLNNVIDLRKSEPIESFYDAIKHIKIPNIYEKRAKKLKAPLGIIKSSEQLRSSIFNPNYEQWDYWIDSPSPSQWFGHYVRLSGIQGVIYPSIRIEGGFNIAIFPDQFKDTSSHVTLFDEPESINNEKGSINSENFRIFL